MGAFRATDRGRRKSARTRSLGSPHDPCPVRRRLAVRQRPAPHRPRGRFRRALRRLQPVHADGRARRPHGVGHRRARHADPRRRRQGGRHRPRPRGQEQRGDRPGPRSTSGLSYDLFTRTTTGNHYPIGAGDVPHRAAQRLHGRADDAGRDQPVDRTHPARPLHRGHLPDLRVRRGARRPVRQLRQPARRHRPDRPALEDQRRDAELRRDPALLPRPAGAGRGAGGVARRARGVGHLAAQRHQVLARTSSRRSGRGR